MFNISYANVSGLRSKFIEVGHHLLDAKPELFQSETGFDNFIPLDGATKSATATDSVPILRTRLPAAETSKKKTRT